MKRVPLWMLLLCVALSAAAIGCQAGGGDATSSDEKSKKKKKKKRKDDDGDDSKGRKRSTGTGDADPKPPAAVAQLMAGADCSPSSNDALRPFCPAVELSSSVPLPDGPTSHPGITVAVSPGKTPKAIALETTHFSVLHLDGSSGRVIRVTPDNEGEKKQLFEAATSVAGFLRGEGPVKLATPLQQFIDGDRAKKRHPLTRHGDHMSFRGSIPADLYASDRGPSYVVVEDAGEVTYVSVFAKP